MKQYQTIELSFQTVSVPVDEVAVDLQGTFICGEETIVVKGFYAGNGTYKVRFLPMQAGKYKYIINGVVNEEGTVIVEPADADPCQCAV